MKNTIRKALLAQEISFGAWLRIGQPASAELLARAGFDWVCVDIEHIDAIENLDCKKGVISS